MTIKLVLSVIIVVTILASITGIILNSNDNLGENNLRIAYFPNIGHVVPIVGMEKGFFAEKISNDTKIKTRILKADPKIIEKAIKGVKVGTEIILSSKK